MIQKIGFSAGNCNKEIAASKVMAKALTQKTLADLASSKPLTRTPDFIELTPRGQFKGAVLSNDSDFLSLTDRGQFAGAVYKKNKL